jgi:hypothetical protein
VLAAVMASRSEHVPLATFSSTSVFTEIPAAYTAAGKAICETMTRRKTKIEKVFWDMFIVGFLYLVMNYFHL